MSSVADKSAGDTSDIISDSSGVGTSTSDTTVSLQPPTTVVCLQPCEPAAPGHLRLNQGDIIEGILLYTLRKVYCYCYIHFILIQLIEVTNSICLKRIGKKLM